MKSLLKLSNFLYKLKMFSYVKATGFLDFCLFTVGINSPSKNQHQNVILFVGEFLPPRIGRIAKSIKKQSNYAPILLCQAHGFVEKFSDNSFEEVLLFRNAWHLKRILKTIENISLVHGFGPKSYFADCARQFLGKPYVHDMQDVYTIYYENDVKLKWLQKELPHEQACLINANGIVAHSMEINIALKKLAPIVKPRTLFFPLYCDDDFFQTHSKALNLQNIHIVYAGAVAGSFRNPNQYGNTQFFKLIDTITSQQLHFHIYPSPSNGNQDRVEYIQLAKTNSYFHFHEDVDQQQLALELSQYDFGILPFFKALTKQSDVKLKYATTLKLFNYIEANLPIIISEDIIFQNWISNRYGIAVNMNDKSIFQLRKTIEHLDYPKLQQKCLSAQQKLSLASNTPRLLNFYTTIINNYNELISKS